MGKLKLPTKIDVFGQTVTIKYHSSPIEFEGRLVYGLYHKEHNHIDIAQHNTEAEILKTLLHEIGHSLLDRVGLWQTSLSHDVHEAIVETYSKFIYEQFIQKQLLKQSSKKPSKPTKRAR